MNGLLTDLYQLTMAAGYFQAGKVSERATFELFIRRLPENRNYVIAAGLAQAVDYLLHLRFTGEEIEYLRGLSQFARVPSEFFETLGKLRFTGDVFAAPEGTPMFAGEPLLILRAPLLEAQIPETYLLATIAFQTMVGYQGFPIGGGGRRTRNGRVWNTPGAFTGSRSAGGPSGLYWRLYWNQQHSNWNSSRGSSIRHRCAFLGALISIGIGFFHGASEAFGAGNHLLG